jgi:diguanylate cyclase (GGDEF)-like protein
MTRARVPVRRPVRETEERGGHAIMSRETRYLLPVLLPVVLAGFAVVAAAVWQTAASPPPPLTAPGVMVLLAAALFCEVFPVPVENLPGGRLSLSTVFVLGAAVLYGWTAAVAVAVLTRVTLDIVERRPRVKLYYNGAVFALAAAAAGSAMSPFQTKEHLTTRLLLEVLAGASAFYAVDVLLVAAILARWSRQPFLPLLFSAAITTAATFAIMASVSLALVVLWKQSPALALVLAGPLVAVALHQRATHNALRAMRLALTDPLTGLGNHRHFQEQLQVDLEAAATARAPLTICLFDLDDFKQINDCYGHPAGDRVLTHVASRLRQLGEAFRLGGDEFAVVLPRQRAERAAAAVEEVVRTLAAEGWEHGPLHMSAGVATYPDHSDDRNALVRVADIALYWAKGEGKNTVCIYRPDMPAVTQLRRLTRAPDRAARLQAAAALATAVDARDAFEGSHSTRVGDLAAVIAGRLELPEEEIELIRLAGRLHDIGKLAVPEEILRKPRALKRRERQILERHPETGHGMLLALDIEPVPTWVLHQHERWDGGGQPSQLVGERIPLGSRIIFVADAWDAMTNVRPYSPALSAAEAREELLRCSGTQFDPVVVGALLDELSEAPESERDLAVVAGASS